MKRLLYELDLRERLRWAPHNLAHALAIMLPRTWGERLHAAMDPSSASSMRAAMLVGVAAGLLGACITARAPVVAPTPEVSPCATLGPPPAIRKWAPDRVVSPELGSFLVHGLTRTTLSHEDVILYYPASRAVVDELAQRRDWDARVALCLGMHEAKDGGN